MNLGMLLYLAVLFVALTPGVLLRIPPKSSLLIAAIVHAVVFALVYHFTYKMVYRFTADGFTTKERFEDGMVEEEEEPSEATAMY